MKKFFTLILSGIFFFLITPSVFAFTGDISIDSRDIRFSSTNFLEGTTVRIYATVMNLSNQDLLGNVRFFDNGRQINGDQAISIFANKTDDVFIDWTPPHGTHTVSVKIYPWNPEIDNPANNSIETSVFVVQDTDHDGIPNTEDEDDDGDGVNDAEDAFPLNPKEQFDTDGDGTGDNADLDDDNDEVPDAQDEMPLDPNETTDTDHDGIGNIADTDDDGDGLSDAEEENLKTDPLKADTDEDGVNDHDDAFPQDPTETLDTDNDKIGNNTDTDDDNDGIPDEIDEFPLNKAPVIKLVDEGETAGLLEETTFDASPSYDEDGDILTYLWEIEGKTYEGNSVKHVFQKTGEYAVNLKITDDNGESKSSNFLVSVVNVRLYTQLVITILTILLALLLFFKYISGAKNSNESV